MAVEVLSKAHRSSVLPEAICLDLDGTLYTQRPVRLLMAIWLMLNVFRRPKQGLNTFRIVSAYRKAQEALRHKTARCDIAQAQIGLTCEMTGLRAEEVSLCTEQWFETEPLRFLRHFVRPGLRDFLEAAKRRGIKLGVVSDYPAESKLAAMDLLPYFDVVLSAQDPTIGCFKPSPAGLELAAQRLGVEKSRMLYIGDRPEVDGEAAQRADMRAIIIGSAKPKGSNQFRQVRTFAELKVVLGI